MKRLRFALAGIFMKTIGQASDGIRLCFKHGLTSGKMLDYIYRNQPGGRWVVGKAIDRFFLNDPGWEAVRTRRRNLEALLAESIQDLRKRRQRVSLLDIASGPADYILSVMEKVKGDDVVAVCQDYDQRWVEEGKQSALRRHVENVRFQQGDAFDRRTLLNITPRPNLVVASGFYDWFTDDAKIQESIRLVFDTLDGGGYFVLSNQMAHPNLEFTEAVFVDFNHKPLRMTMRPKERLIQWLEQTGFRVETVRVDGAGCYCVIKAFKPV